MQQIPLSQIPAQTLNVVLAGQYCTLSLYWRQTRLYLDLSVGPVEICRGAVCQNRAEVVQPYVPNFSGRLHFFDTEGDRPPQWNGVHTGASGRWLLVYVEEGEALPEELRY